MVDISKYVLITSGIGARGSGGGGSDFVSSLSISGVPGPAGIGSPYNFTPIVEHNIGLTVFTLQGTLPPGLSFNYLDGSISGTPTVMGITTGLSITVYDMFAAATLSNLSIDVGESYTPSLIFSDARNSQYYGQVV